jgi:hypothetical protein
MCVLGQHKPDKGFSAFLETMDAAQRELQSGRGKAYKDLWSRSSDVTLSGGFGGRIERGWADVEKRLDWVAKQFSNGSNRIERLVASSDHDLGYVVQTEHLEFTVPGRNSVSTKDYRVTMVFRREHGKWKIVHRQADSNLIKEVQ